MSGYTIYKIGVVFGLFFYEYRYFIRRMLQVVIHSNYKVSGTMVQSAKNSVMLAKVFCHANSGNLSGVTLLKFFNYFPGVILRAIVYQHKLERYINTGKHLIYG